jgi:hypothetical protein
VYASISLLRLHPDGEPVVTNLQSRGRHAAHVMVEQQMVRVCEQEGGKGDL